MIADAWEEWFFHLERAYEKCPLLRKSVTEASRNVGLPCFFPNLDIFFKHRNGHVSDCVIDRAQASTAPIPSGLAHPTFTSPKAHMVGEKKKTFLIRSLSVLAKQQT